MATQYSLFKQKIDLYKTFLQNKTLRRLIVCGEGGTGKSITLKIACQEVNTHAPLQIVYTHEPTVSIPMKDYSPQMKELNLKYNFDDERDFDLKTIVHCYTFNEEDFNNETQIVVFTHSVLSNLTDTFHE